MSTTITKRRRPDDWRVEFYKNGYPKDVVVIEDTPPPPSQQQQQQQQQQHYQQQTPQTPQTPPPHPATMLSQPQMTTHDEAILPSLYSSSTSSSSTSSYYPSQPTSAAQHLKRTLPPQNFKLPPHAQNPLKKPRLDHRQPLRPFIQDYSAIYSLPKPSDTWSIKPIIPCDDKDGHYIIRDGEFLTERYKIIRLLGQGTFGKVVECYDRVRQTFCAIKIIRAIQKYKDASKIEIRVLNTLKKSDPLNLNQCIHSTDWFEHRGHVCMVFELLGQSVFDFLKSNDFKPFPSYHIQQFAKQLLNSIFFVHSLKLIHTDLKPENILLVNQPSTGLSAYEKNQSTHSILQDTEIRLIDFGSATFENDYHASIISTRHYRAPEVILGLGWSYPCDMWSIGCILVEFFTGEALFQTHDNLEHLSMMQVVLGPIPHPLIRAASKDAKEFFVNDRLGVPIVTTQQSRKYIQRLKHLRAIISPSTQLNMHFLDLLEKMLVYDPKHRITARDALCHPFFDGT